MNGGTFVNMYTGSIVQNLKKWVLPWVKTQETRVNTGAVSDEACNQSPGEKCALEMFLPLVTPESGVYF